MRSTISPQTALIYTMVITSAADRDMTDQEIFAIGEIVRTLPAFDEFEADNLTAVAADCAALLEQEEGLETIFGLIRESLHGPQRETAYALACDVAAADGNVGQEELRMLEMLRYRLDIDRLVAAAIERGARARHLRP